MKNKVVALPLQLCWHAQSGKGGAAGGGVGDGKCGNDRHGIDVEMEAALFGTRVGWRRRLWSVAAVVETINGRCRRANKQ
jgi:hypothetical protein